MNTLFLFNVFVAGLCAFAAVHYLIQWWFSRRKSVLLVFAIQCALYAVFSWEMGGVLRATTIAESQTALDWSLSLGLISHGVIIHFYAHLAQRRDLIVRVIVTMVFVAFALINLWLPLRGTVIALHPVTLAGGIEGSIPIRTPPGALLVVMYLAVLTLHIYGVVAIVSIWKRDRTGAVLLLVPLIAMLAGILVGVLADFAHVRAPYVGAAPHVIFVLCMAISLAREYSAREARIVDLQRHFEVAVDHAPIGKAVVAPDGRVLRCNRALCRLFDATRDQICGQPLNALVQWDDDCCRDLVDEPENEVVERRFRRTNGEPRWVLVAVARVPDDRGQPASFIVQMEDITELRAHRTQLEEIVATRTRELSDAKTDAERANEAKSTFLAHVSHEIRTPLGVIMMYAQLLQRDRTLGDAQRKKIDTMFSSGRHLLTLLNDVLEMSKLEAGRVELVEGKFDPWAALDEIERMFAVECAAHGTELTISRAPDFPRALFGDGGKVKQILINLTGNAIKFTARGKIHISASARALSDDDTLVEIVVADTGIGIAAADAARLFQPFEQAKAGAKAGGTGLGLAISLSHARLMGGDLTLQSTPGAGSTFTFTFKARHVGPSLASEPRANTPLPIEFATQRKVLVVDDLETNRDVLAEVLAGSSFELRTAADGPGALALHAEWSPDLVLLDLRMPEMDGLEVLRRMRDSGSTAAIGVLSASALAADEREALALGADFFMRKPYDDRELISRIKQALVTRIGLARATPDPG